MIVRGHVLRFAPGTQRIVGLTVINARWLLDRDGRLAITIPEIVEASADELAPALHRLTAGTTRHELPPPRAPRETII